jgi:hypothetical protein
MRATGRKAWSGTPYLAVAALLATTLANADTHADILDLVGSMASALSENNAPGFLATFDKAMLGYDHLHEAIPALLDQGEITSSVEPLRDDGDEAKRTVDLDWYLEIHNPDATAPVIRRREVIHCRFEKQGKHWRVTSLDPVSFFDPENLAHK